MGNILLCVVVLCCDKMHNIYVGGKNFGDFIILLELKGFIILNSQPATHNLTLKGFSIEK